jgi:hypothetical protein
MQVSITLSLYFEETNFFNISKETHVKAFSVNDKCDWKSYLSETKKR